METVAPPMEESQLEFTCGPGPIWPFTISLCGLVVFGFFLFASRRRRSPLCPILITVLPWIPIAYSASYVFDGFVASLEVVRKSNVAPSPAEVEYAAHFAIMPLVFGIAVALPTYLSALAFAALQSLKRPSPTIATDPPPPASP